jgi:hypothetical protein
VTFEKGILGSIDRRAPLGLEPRARPLAALSGDDRLQAGQGVDPELGHQRA